MTTMLETCGIPPPPSAAAELVVPLCFFDLTSLHYPPIRRLIFYDHPCSESDFFNDVVPKLKQSLSLTLNYYLPVAGNLLYPSDTNKKPVIRYVSGDKAPLTIAVSGQDFDELTGNHARDSDQFYDFMPEMPAVREEGEYKLVPLIALQLTLFPGCGICVGVSNHHCLGDARSIVGFVWAWAEINKSGSDEEFLSRNSESLPFFDRSVVGDSNELDDKFWNVMNKIPLNPPSLPLPTNRVRSSFTLTQSDIKNLKKLILSKNPDLVHVSSFVITTSYAWSCLVKSDAAADKNEDEVFSFAADGRNRPNALVDPPIPVNYFGNCLGGGMVKIKHKDLAAEDGFLTAAAAISEQITQKIYNKDEFLSRPDSWLSSLGQLMEMKWFAVTGSPKFDLLNADFGWGKATKVEVLSLDGWKYLMSLCNSEGGLVVGMSLPKERMEAFSALFADGLVKLMDV